MRQLRAVELEVALHRRDTLGWAAEVRVSDPKGDTENVKEGRIGLDLDGLARLAAQRDGYARLLTEAFFGDDAVSWGFTLARERAATESGPLRLRLRIGPSAPELHAVRWELLRDPENRDANLVTQERVIFSRFLDSRDYRTVEVRPDQAMRAVLAVAGPEAGSLKRYEEDGRSLARVEVAAEIARARSALKTADVTSIGEAEPVTLDRLLAALRAGTDILYLVCHGWINRQGRDPGPRLLLQDDNGEALHVTGREFVSRLRELLDLPRLVVLASCMSAAPEAADSASTQEDGASTQDDGALSAVGPEIRGHRRPSRRRDAGQHQRRHGHADDAEVLLRAPGSIPRSTAPSRSPAASSRVGTTGGCPCSSCAFGAAGSGMSPASPAGWTSGRRCSTRSRAVG